MLQRGSAEKVDADAVVEEIRGLCSGKDRAAVDFLLDGWDSDKLDAAFYRRAESHPDRFIRAYFSFDRLVRNAKVRYLNRALGRPEDLDCILLRDDEDTGCPEADTALGAEGILERERALDALMWERTEQLIEMSVLDLDLILAFIVKLKITDRWLKLDPESGREMLRTIVEEIKNTKTI